MLDLTHILEGWIPSLVEWKCEIDEHLYEPFLGRTLLKIEFRDLAHAASYQFNIFSTFSCVMSTAHFRVLQRCHLCLLPR